jgi:hypothetical protein
MLLDPLVPKDFAGWFGRVVGVFRAEFGRLAVLATVPAVLTAAYLVALGAVRQSPQELQQRFAAAAASSPTRAVGTGDAFSIVFGRMLPIMLIFMVVMLVVGALFEGAGVFTVLRRANGQPASPGAALRFALPRVPAFVGWSMLGWLALIAAVGLPLLPGILAHVGALVVVGGLVSLVGGLLVAVTVFSSLFGVVLVERAGISRCRELIRDRFAATTGRVLVAGVIYVGYSILSGLLVSGVAALVGPGVIASVVQGAVVIPALVFQVAASLVTYAELRHHENRSVSTPTLAAELMASPAMPENAAR